MAELGQGVRKGGSSGLLHKMAVLKELELEEEASAVSEEIQEMLTALAYTAGYTRLRNARHTPCGPAPPRRPPRWAVRPRRPRGSGGTRVRARREKTRRDTSTDEQRPRGPYSDTSLKPSPACALVCRGSL